MRISTQIRPYFYHRAKARYTTSWASSSNGQSTGLLIQGLWVRIPRGLPFSLSLVEGHHLTDRTLFILRPFRFRIP